MNIIVANKKDAQTIADIISKSNEDVAVKFGINKDNNPKHPSFCDENWVLSDFDRGEKYFLYQLNDIIVGCVAFEQPGDDVGYLNRLSVLPSFRKQGIGEQLTRYIFQYGKSKGVSKISIGMIANHTELKEWYSKIGFAEIGLKKFSHLPFDVLFMRYEL